MCVCQLKIINLLPDKFTCFYQVITYISRPIYKEVLPPDTRQQYQFYTLMLKSQIKSKTKGVLAHD